MNENYRERIGWIDTARGMGYILVVAGHILGNYSYEGVVISSFHIPLFFFLAGCVDRPEKYHFREYITKLFFRLIVPFFCFALLTLAYEAVIYPQIVTELSYEWIKDDLYKMTLEHIDGVYLWFFWGLFWTKLLFWLLIHYAKKPGLILAAAWLMEILAILFDGSNRINLPFRLDSAMFLILFYTLGHYSSRFQIKKIWQAALLLILTSSVSALSYKNEAVSAAFILYGKSYSFFLINAISGIIMMICFAQLIEWKLPNIRIFKAINALTIEMLGTQVIAIDIASKVQSQMSVFISASHRVTNYICICMALLINYYIAKLIVYALRFMQRQKR